MDRQPPAAVLDLLARRAELLDRLVESPAEKSDLVDALDVSRSTVDRALRELVDHDLVEQRPDGYRATTPGRLAVESYGQFRRRTERIREATDVLRALPPDAPLEARALAGAEIVTPTANDPGLPIRRIGELLRETDGVRGIARAVTERYVELYRDRILDGTTVRLVFAPASLERLLANYADAVAVALETGRVELRESPDSDLPPFGLRLYSTDETTTVGLTIYDADDDLRAFVRTDDPAAVEWAEARIERVWTNARPIPTP
ncbi:helix-turn-helix transcriptional regulator [Halomarina pelagica]|uniref:helix-turn-helix transcriptional regulator n=1 Tax=Halomarina pelagica TaxID=2961599 RepID=UPI0020C50D92|nr:helix-turn-helix domain-containing protein [Halomarina sp. BND7]